MRRRGHQPNDFRTVILPLDLREASAWQHGGAQEEEIKRRLPRGSVLIPQIPSPVPVGFAHVLELAGHVCAHRLILGWPAGSDTRGLKEALWLRNLEFNPQASKWLQQRAKEARDNTWYARS